MIRVEVVANRAIQEDFFERLEAAGIGAHYTLFPEAQGAGDAGPKRGDHIWPEENFVWVSYTDESCARQIYTIASDLREKFPDEGIRCFGTQAVDLS